MVFEVEIIEDFGDRHSIYVIAANQKALDQFMMNQHPGRIYEIQNKYIDRFEGRYVFLSNFYPSPIEYHRVIYPTAEHAFQAMKTTDLAEREVIAAKPSPGSAKRHGRKVHLRSDWEDIKDREMYRILKEKFKPGTNLAQALLDTEDAYLIEGNSWHDNYWGDCDCDRCSDTIGKNHLGQILMFIREELKKESENND